MSNQPSLFLDFIARADFMDNEELNRINVDNDFNEKIRKALLDRGAKLLIGPRGTGKTHQMRLAHINSMSNPSKPFTVFVTFNRYIYLEPLTKKSSSARKVFHIWALIQILLACRASMEERGIDISKFFDDLPFSQAVMSEFIAKAEKSLVPESEELLSTISVDYVKQKLEMAALAAGRKRCVILMDDAAISLSGDYFEEFLDIFQSLKAIHISPKASVYPGTDYFGSRFSLRHDAEPIYAWMSINDENFESCMSQVVRKHLSIGNEFSELVAYFSYASFGIPRALLSMMKFYIQITTGKNIISTRNINRTLQQQVDLLNDELSSLKLKYPQYQSIISASGEMFSNLNIELVRINKDLTDTRQTMIGIQNDQEYQSPLAQKMFNMLMEAGLLFKDSAVKHGSEPSGKTREYERYISHLVFLIEKGAFKKGRSLNLQNEIAALRAKNEKHPLRKSISNLIFDRSLVRLDLPLCQNCKTPRINDSQKFCGNCGERLIDRSVFEICMETPIDNLPLTKWEKQKISEYTNFKKVSDFINTQDPKGALRVAPRIGEVRAANIIDKVQKYITEVIA